MAAVKKRKNKNGISWRAEVRKAGIYKSITGKTKSEVLAEAARIESEIKAGRFFEAKHSFKNALDRYTDTVLSRKKSAASQKSQYSYWLQQFGHMKLSDIKHGMISECKDNLLKTMKPASVTAYLSALSHLFTVAMEWEWIESNPVARVKKPGQGKGRDRFLNESEREALLSACQKIKNKYLYTIVVIAISTGMRKGEIMGLKWSDINLDENYLILREQKNKETSAIPLHGKAHELIAALPRTSAYLFPNHAGTGPLKIDDPWKKALKLSGVQDFVFHDLRHTAASYIAMNGGSGVQIAATLRHKSLAHVQRYAHLTDNHVADVVQSMNSKIFK